MVDKDANAVLDEIEAAMLQVAATILQGNGFAYDLPSRAKGNQLYVPELDRIVLKVCISGGLLSIHVLSHCHPHEPC